MTKRRLKIWSSVVVRQWWRNLPIVGIDDKKMRPVALSFVG
jgi:hypothetical protein